MSRNLLLLLPHQAAATPPSGPSDAYINNMITLSPEAYYPLNENSGTTDLSGNGFDVVAHNVTFNTDTGIGDGYKAATFDGASSYIDLANMLTAFNGNSGTLVFWAKTAAWADAVQRFAVRFAVTGNSLNVNKSIPTNQLQFTRIANTSSTKSVVDTSLAGTGDYFFCAFTWSTVNAQIKAFINGSQVGSTLAPVVGFTASPTTAAIGASAPGGSGFWVGNIAHLAVFNIVLDPTVIASLATV